MTLLVRKRIAQFYQPPVLMSKQRLHELIDQCNAAVQISEVKQLPSDSQQSDPQVPALAAV